jgi:hypothetical protein
VVLEDCELNRLYLPILVHDSKKLVHKLCILVLFLNETFESRLSSNSVWSVVLLEMQPDAWSNPMRSEKDCQTARISRDPASGKRCIEFDLGWMVRYTICEPSDHCQESLFRRCLACAIQSDLLDEHSLPPDLHELADHLRQQHPNLIAPTARLQPSRLAPICEDKLFAFALAIPFLIGMFGYLANKFGFLET